MQTRRTNEAVSTLSHTVVLEGSVIGWYFPQIQWKSYYRIENSVATVKAVEIWNSTSYYRNKASDGYGLKGAGNNSTLVLPEN